MELKFIKYEKRGHLAYITLNRPEVMNALHPPCHLEMDQVWDDFAGDREMWVAILTGAGERAFSAGNDLKWTAEHRGERPQMSKGGFAGITSRFDLTKPIIAAVNGFALGGGCELAMACHIRFASEAAKFGQPESKLGLLPGYGGTQRLPRLVGKGRAIQLLLTGEMIDAAEAFRIGLVNRVVSADHLMNEARSTMKTILANAPLAVALCIEAIDRGLEMSLEEGFILEANHFGLLAATGDMREGTSAFIEKRAPVVKGK